MTGAGAAARYRPLLTALALGRRAVTPLFGRTALENRRGLALFPSDLGR